jgi:hypothetical protein
MQFKASTIWDLAFFLLVFFTPACWGNPKLSPLDDKKLSDLLATIDPWPSGNLKYSKVSWEHMFSAAKYIRGCDPESVFKTLHTYENKYPYRRAQFDLDSLPGHKLPSNSSEELGKLDKTIEEDTKIFLLMRVLFNLPEHATSRPRFYPWHENHTDLDSNGTVNVAWPITWKSGNPQLVTGETGIQGVVDLYLPAEEYDYFLRHYPMRELTTDTNK